MSKSQHYWASQTSNIRPGINPQTKLEMSVAHNVLEVLTIYVKCKEIESLPEPKYLAKVIELKRLSRLWQALGIHDRQTGNTAGWNLGEFARDTRFGKTTIWYGFLTTSYQIFMTSDDPDSNFVVDTYDPAYFNAAEIWQLANAVHFLLYSKEPNVNV